LTDGAEGRDIDAVLSIDAVNADCQHAFRGTAEHDRRLRLRLSRRSGDRRRLGQRQAGRQRGRYNWSSQCKNIAPAEAGFRFPFKRLFINDHGASPSSLPVDRQAWPSSCGTPSYHIRYEGVPMQGDSLPNTKKRSGAGRGPAPDGALCDRIIGAAFGAFMAKGYASTSMLEIAT